MMTASAMGQVWLNRQADRIERTLSSLELPVRVSGGQVRERGVCYHLTPLGATQIEAIEGAEGAVATALGVDQVRVAREIGGLAMEVMPESEGNLRLLPLMHAIGQLPPLTAVLGMAAAGYPLTLSLEDSASQHLLVQGPAGSGKSELLRTLMLSLALTSRPAQLQIMAIDASARQLTCLEGLPHALTEIATETEFALELLKWLTEEADRRRTYAIDQPALLLIVDELDNLPAVVRQAFFETLKRVQAAGEKAGVHIIAAGRRLDVPLESRGVARAAALEQGGHFSFQTADHHIEAAVGWMPVRDLHTAVSLAKQYPGTVDHAQLTAVLSEAV